MKRLCFVGRFCGWSFSWGGGRGGEGEFASWSARCHGECMVKERKEALDRGIRNSVRVINGCLFTACFGLTGGLGDGGPRGLYNEDEEEGVGRSF